MAPGPRKIVVLTTSYPRHAEDFAGRFVADAVAEIRARGVEVEVLHPGTIPGFGGGYDGGGFVGRIKRRPWLAPLLFLAIVRALRKAARDADLVHVHWLAGALAGRFAGKPFVVTLHGTGSAGRFSDLELARRRPGVVRFLLRPARAVIAASRVLEEAVQDCGVDTVRFIPYGVAVQERDSGEAEEPYVLYAGRLSPEKGIHELVAATAGMRLVAAGDGPLRELLPDALGFVPHDRLVDLYEKAAVVVCSSYSEGLPLCVIEAMAHGRPVVATTVGGIPQLVDDGRTGYLVPPRDADALRAALQRLIADKELRRRMGRRGRQKIEALCAWEHVTDSTLAAYADAAGPSAPRPRRPLRAARRSRLAV